MVDLAKGHVKAIKKLADKEGVSVYNLGTGNGYSVLQVVAAFEKACGHAIPYEIKPRRGRRYRHLLLRSLQGKERAGLGGCVRY